MVAGLIVAAVPLMAASEAQAALGGANPLTTTGRADLRSATITGSNSVRFCFDKPVQSVTDQGGFSVGGYRASTTLLSYQADASGSCVDALFNSSDAGDVGDIQTYTYAQVSEGVVRIAGNVFGNRADSVALTGSDSGSGTRGLTQSPDLTGVEIVDNNRLAFKYDQNVRPATVVGAGGFHFYSYNSVTNLTTDVKSDTAGISPTDPTVVIAKFPSAVGALTNTGTRAYSIAGSVQAQTADHTASGFDSAAIPGTLGLVQQAPDLTGAQYSRQPAGNIPAAYTCSGVTTDTCVVVDYTFDEAVTINNAAATLANYQANLSDGSTLTPTAVYEPSGTDPALQTGSTTVRAVFSPEARRVDEYLVGAVVTNNPGVSAAAISTTNAAFNTIGSAPVGGNTGFSGGFSTAPDAFRVTFDVATNTASVLFDQRVFDATPSAFGLLDANGNQFAVPDLVSACAPNTVGFPCPITPPGTPTGELNPGPNTIYLRFPAPAVQVGNGKSLEIRGRINGATPAGTSVRTSLGILPVSAGSTADDAGNLQQIIAPTSISSVKKLGKPKKMSSKRLSKAAAKKMAAKNRALFKKRLAKGYYKHAK